MKITKVMKFGGSSVGSPKMIKEVAAIAGASARKEGTAIVVSAFQGVTDQLLRCAQLGAARSPKLDEELEELRKRHLQAIRQLVKGKKAKQESEAYVAELLNELRSVLDRIKVEEKVSDRNLDHVASFGERLCAYIVAASLKGGYFVDARELVKTDGSFVHAAVDFSKTDRNISAFFKGKKGIPVITGFLGSTDRGTTTTLGRGGSDYSAAIFGAALNVKVIEIWTDVDGILSADPRIVKNAVVLPEVSYEEAIEMAYFGAKVIHPATMLPAVRKNIPVVIKNTFHPQAEGTWIRAGGNEEGMRVKCLTGIDDVALVNIAGVSLAGIPGSAARVFRATERAKANVILISQASSEHTICIAIKSSELPAALEKLQQEFIREVRNGLVHITATSGQAILALVGDGMRGVPGIAGTLFRALGENDVSVSAIAQGGSERNISFAVRADDKVRAMNAAHNVFFEKSAKNIFLVGTGTIGAEFLHQIAELQKQGAALRVCGIATTTKMLLDPQGIDAHGWKQALSRGKEADIDQWIADAQALVLPNSVFVDCTASDAVVKKYQAVAEAGFHIVTPNKKFNVLGMREYRRIREIMAKNRKQFRYETNVGAALPVIGTLRDLLVGGDRIVKIEGIFSGTLSFIFNTFDGTRGFSEVVAEAKKLGYTEPDPREDLNGNDVGRKLLVLAREIGLAMEFKDIRIENLVPTALRNAKNADAFLKGLRASDKAFEKMAAQAYAQKKVLRYVARIEYGKASASLQAVSVESPLAGTRGADNIFAITTRRYAKRPLVVQGPGAGAEVTAAGVVADILKI
ncbi:bifunctional aspartate kinase/homoserine dehydrogenase I [Patescibacteria group bacterium]|nr:bifunctional aspartate kinase/homoserine dehydrogenase I [Patescibacteria group bacterium]